VLNASVSAAAIVPLCAAAALAFVALRTELRRRHAQRHDALEAAVAARTAELQAENAQLVAERATREAADARQRQTQKLAAVGQLTGGIAHDFNNMLAVVLGGVELAKRRLSDGKGDPGRHLDSALEGATRAAALTRRLLALSQAEPLEPVAIDVDALIAEMSDRLARVVGEPISVSHLARAAGWPVLTDRSQFENTILDLSINARDAMECGGQLTLATSQQHIRPGEIADLAAGDYVRLTVSDTGTGIDRATLDRIFEPFFTTKPPGHGTGLGLSQALAFARQSGGWVTVDSMVGTGTTVALYLPRHAGVVALHRPEGATAAVPSQAVKLLVVEDDCRVLAATVEALEELGHRPVASLGIDAAATLLRTHSDIALVVSDVLMPGMTGPELVADLRRIRPELRAIYVTGFSGDIDRAGFGGDPVLRKPFTISALGMLIDRVLRDAAISPLETRAAA